MPHTEVATMDPETPAPGLSVVVPCYNEAAVLPAFYDRMRAACLATGLSFELVFVNDGSTDGTWEIIRAFSARDASVVGLDLSRNHGHQLALTAGLQHARGLRILIIDADLQDPPELLGEMTKMLDAGADVVFGKRARRDGETWFKRTTAAVFYRLLNTLNDTPIPPDTGDFRLMRRNVLDQLLRLQEQPRFIRGMVSWLGFRQVAIPYNRSQRAAGDSKYPFGKMLRFAFDAITSFSIKPLKLATYLGLGAGFIALILAFYSVFEWFSGHTLPGWTSLIVVVLLLGSAQLFVLGIIGEYLGRLTMQAKNRPLFIVREIVRGSAPSAAPKSDPR
jgi:glycosyltransferase involved in cell wall biosynthesis